MGTVRIGKDEKLGGCRAPFMFVGYFQDHNGNYYCMNPKTMQATETRDVIFLKQMYFQKQDSSEVWCEPVVYVTQFKNPKIKIEKESNKFFEGNPNVYVMLKARREKEYIGMNEISLDLRYFSWHSVRTRSG